MTLASPTNTLAYFQALALTSKRDLRGVLLGSVVGQLNAMLTDDPDLVRPESEAYRFYGMNHGMALIRGRRDLLEPLTPEEMKFVAAYHDRLGRTARKVFSYLLVTCTREARHCHTAPGNLTVLSSDLPAEADAVAHEQVQHALNWLLASHGGEDGIYGALREKPPVVPIGAFVRALSVAFHRGSWSSNYGGPAWGGISDCLCRFVEGEYSAEMMLDVAWTLEHNTASVFNKGLIFFGVTSLLAQILDVQRSGQVPELILADKPVWVDADLRESMEWLRSEFPDEVMRYVDWFKVEALGALGSYGAQQNAQIEKHGPSPWMGEKAKQQAAAVLAAKAAAEAHAKEWFQVMPGVEVKFKQIKRAA